MAKKQEPEAYRLRVDGSRMVGKLHFRPGPTYTVKPAIYEQIKDIALDVEIIYGG